jgi:hypothetical protein
MKLPTGALLAIVAATASASLFLEAPQRHAIPAAEAAVATPPPQPTVVPRPAPRALFEIRQAPVPSLRLAPHTTFFDKPASMSASVPGSALASALPNVEQAEASPDAPATSGAPNMSADAARAAILADGYRSVRALEKVDDGHWAARVLRGRTEIAVTVDTEGRVSAN